MLSMTITVLMVNYDCRVYHQFQKMLHQQQSKSLKQLRLPVVGTLEKVILHFYKINLNLHSLDKLCNRILDYCLLYYKNWGSLTHSCYRYWYYIHRLLVYITCISATLKLFQHSTFNFFPVVYYSTPGRIYQFIKSTR